MRFASPSSFERVGECRPRQLERGHQEDDHGRDPDRERVDPDLRLALVAAEEDAVDQVDRPERERRRDERQPEPVHLPQQPAVELEAELVATIGEQDDVDRQRAEEVADHGADRALVRADDERDRGADRDQDVGDARDRELHGPLLDPEERRHLGVVHLRPEADEAGADEPRVVPRSRASSARCGVRDRTRQPSDEPERCHPHREPERGPDDERPARLVVGVEVEAEERARDPEPQHDHEHARQRDHGLDLAEADGAEVDGVDREQEDGDQARDDPAESVDGRLRAESLELADEHYSAA